MHPQCSTIPIVETLGPVVARGRSGSSARTSTTISSEKPQSPGGRNNADATAARRLDTMFHLHCTRKLRDRLGHQPTSVPESTPASTLGHWYATVLFWRPQVVLCVNERTLLPVLIPLVPAATLPARFPEALATVLQAHGWDTAKIDAEMQHMHECEIVKTANRSVVGMLNEFAFLARVWKEEQDAPPDLRRLSMKLADVPCKPLRYDSPAQRVRALAKSTTPAR